MTEPLDIEAIKARCEAATEGPWETDGSQVTCYGGEGAITERLGIHEDARFIAHARTDLPAVVEASEMSIRVAEGLSVTQATPTGSPISSWRGAAGRRLKSSTGSG